MFNWNSILFVVAIALTIEATNLKKLLRGIDKRNQIKLKSYATSEEATGTATGTATADDVDVDYELLDPFKTHENSSLLSGSDSSALVFQFSGSSLDWPCAATKNIYLESGRYVQENVLVMRAQMLAHGLYVALPRYKPGVPFTLGKVLLQRGKCTPKIAPYPNWSAQEEGNCDALQSVVDIFLDHHNILWALDVGIVNSLVHPIRRCPPKIVAINTKYNRIVRKIDLNDFVTFDSELQFLVVDYGKKDENPFVYVADGGSRAILAYDVIGKTGSRIVLPRGITNTAERDTLYIALVTNPKGATKLFFTFLYSARLYAIKSEYLRTGMGTDAVIDVGAKPYGRTMILLGSDGGSTLFFRYNGDNDIYMWNSGTCFKDSNLKEVQHGGSCRLTTQVLPGHRRFMWSLESNFPDFLSGNTGCNGASVLLRPLAKFHL